MSVQVPVEEVREALRCLYDGVALANVPLAQRLPDVAARADQPSRAQRLRAMLLDAIELLQPSRPAAFRSAATRSYQVLALHYLDGLPVAQIAEELHISERQAYRDLARAEESLASMLAGNPWPATAATTPDGAASGPQAADRPPLEDELSRLTVQPTSLDPLPCLRNAVRLVAALAREWSVELVVDLPPALPIVSANEALLRQTLVQMLSAAIRSARGPVRLSAAPDGQSLAVSVSFRPRPQAGESEFDAPRCFAEVQALVEAQRLRWRSAVSAEGTVHATLSLLTQKRRTVLVVEDNKGAIELYRRYLATSDDWELCEVPDPRLSFEMAKAQQPAVILLDILMPQQDGWSVLQLLRSQPETKHIPVLVCSVFNELELASALGASGYLKKPVSQFQLLAALQHCLQG